MFPTSARRIKDRDGGDGAASAVKAPSLRSSKSLTPASSSDKIPSVNAFRKLSAEKENRRSTSRGATVAPAQKPTIRPLPRVDKASLVGVGNGSEVRERKSTSSVPRGRSSSPSDFSRMFSDTRKDRRVSVDRIVKAPVSESDRSISSGGRGTKVANPAKGYRDLNVKGSVQVSGRAKFRGETNENATKSLNSEIKSANIGGLVSKIRESENNNALVKSSAVRVRGNLQLLDEKVDSQSELNIQTGVGIGGHKEQCFSVGVEKNVNGIDSCVTEFGGKSAGSSKGLEISKEKAPGDGGVSSGVSIKYSSRLHEKLAFLEGKVKRIASDIRRTKEMLDMNNPDASKMILSDIQDKISGIEKAIDHVASDSDSKMQVLKSDEKDDQESKMVVNSQTKQADKGKCVIKELNSEELEARLFPHRKLLQNRTTNKASTGGCLSNKSSVIELGMEPMSMEEEKVLSSVEESSIALEFLANLNKETSKVTSRDGQADMKYCGVQEAGGGTSGRTKDSSSTFNQKCDIDLLLTTDEKLEEFDDQENRQAEYIEETEDDLIYSLNDIGTKTSVGGWFVSEGEAVVLAHDDGSCSYYDIANCEEKAVYMPPFEVSPNMWRDCWIIRAPGSDGCSGRFVVAASAGNTMDSGFCSWDFYSKDLRAFQVEVGSTATSRTALRPLSNNVVQRRNSASSSLTTETRQWWYKPCGPLIISTGSSQRAVKVFDIRDGEQIMKWEVQKPVLTMDYSSPLQWRNRGKVVVAEAETISLWDVNSLSPQALLSIPSSGQKLSALHVCNTDAELGGGVRQRVSSSEAEGNDGVFCTSDSINILDFRQPSGVGLRISKHGINVQSIFTRGDSIFLGCSTSSSIGKKQPSTMLQQFSLRKQGLFSTYAMPESNSHSHHSAITQVWGNSKFVMGVCGLGLFVFDAQKDDPMRAFNMDTTNTQSVSQVIGPDDLYWPSFDYLGSRALLISRDRPAMWKHLP
ncbi:KIN14B-interacting protein [Senna tora]|uniref:KIN14B-interacting protein n=1 Tax=Senna tora TaxID=362788 RepID=A0A835CBS6_9FABA|nr:KIN14B-interacting protein [Senna tora]